MLLTILLLKRPPLLRESAMTMRISGLGLSVVLIVLSGMHRTTQAADWPRYYGPNADGIATEADWLSDWSRKKPAIEWTVQVGSGSNSVAVSNGMLVTSGYSGGQNTIFILDAQTGKEQWKHVYRSSNKNKFGNRYPGGPQGTATFDGDRFYIIGQYGEMFCVDARKKRIVWQKNLMNDHGGKPGNWGFATSPLIDGENVIVDTGSPRGSTVALNKNTGALVWSSGSEEMGYSSPIIRELSGQRTLLLVKANALIAMNPADGKELWRHPWKSQYGVSGPLPAVQENMLFLTSGYNKGSVMLKVGADSVQEVYSNREISCQMATPIYYDGHLYAVSGDTGRGDLVCIEWATGKEKWRDETFGTGSIMIAEDKLIGLTEGGELRVGPASPDGPKWTGKHKVLSGVCWIVPVLSNKRIYCKNNDGELVCVDVTP